MLTCAIIDDEPLALGLLESYVKKTPNLTLVGCYSSAIQAMKVLVDQSVDLIFLDIQMPELDGIQFSKMVDPKTRIVFTTAFGQYAIDSYKVNALDYLLKPISYTDFIQAVNKAVHWFELVAQNTSSADSVKNTAQPQEQYIFVKSDYKLIRIDLNKILFIEGLKDYVKIYEEDQPRPILSLISMKAMIDQLPPEQFMRVHRSYIVRKDKIRVIDHSRIVFGKDYIPISDNYKQTVQDYVNKKTV